MAVREKVTALPDRKPSIQATEPPAAVTEAVVTAVMGLQQTLSIQLSREIAERVAEVVQAGTRASAAGVFHAVASLLAVRFLLLLALLGAFALAFLALRNGTYEAGGVLIAYCALVLLPLVWLERAPRAGGGHAP